MEKSRYTLLSNNSPRRINCSPIVVSGFEERIVVTALQLQSGLQDFGGDIDKRGGEVGNKTCTD